MMSIPAARPAPAPTITAIAPPPVITAMPPGVFRQVTDQVVAQQQSTVVQAQATPIESFWTGKPKLPSTWKNGLSSAQLQWLMARSQSFEGGLVDLPSLIAGMQLTPEQAVLFQNAYQGAPATLIYGASNRIIPTDAQFGWLLNHLTQDQYNNLTHDPVISALSNGYLDANDIIERIGLNLTQANWVRKNLYGLPEVIPETAQPVPSSPDTVVGVADPPVVSVTPAVMPSAEPTVPGWMWLAGAAVGVGALILVLHSNDTKAAA